MQLCRKAYVVQLAGVINNQPYKHKHRSCSRIALSRDVHAPAELLTCVCVCVCVCLCVRACARRARVFVRATFPAYDKLFYDKSFYKVENVS